jgi:hypothetical protein
LKNNKKNMATCVFECTPELQKRVGSNSSVAAASLRPMAMPTEFSLKNSTSIALSNKPGTSSFGGQQQNHHRGIKRRSGTSTSTSLSWTDDDSTAATILSMSNQFSTSTISGAKLLPQQQPIITSSNDPTDILLHQLSQVCEQAQKTTAFGDEPQQQSKTNSKLTINTVLESDRNSSTLKTTKLANHFISCFIVGGEIRLCSAQIHAVIMKDVHEDDITHWIRELNIIDHMASQEQITSLKLNRAIPAESGICGLMTKTNAERLVGALIDPVNYRTLPNEKKDKFEPILIEHDCFGGCEGRLYSFLFPGPCVECTQCKCLMTTESFCRHSHISPSETTVSLCHWGFDAANWSKYIRLHQLVESDQESANRFYSLIKSSNNFEQQEDTLEDNLEVYAKKQPMISAPLSALAALAQLQNQQQQQFQASQQPSSSAIVAAPVVGVHGNNGVVSAPSSLPTSSFIPPPSLAQQQSSTASGSSINIPQTNGILPSSLPTASAAAPTNPSSLSQLLQQQQLLGQLQNILTPNQQQQTSPNNLLLAMLQQAQIQHQQQQQQQYQTAINALRNVGGVTTNSNQMNDDSEIPRKRAHTISDPSSATIRTKPDDFSLSSISFGMLQSDQQLLSVLSQVTEGDTLRRVAELVNVSITQRVQPIVEDNARLRKELQQAQDEIKNKNDILAKLAVAHVQHLQLQQQQHRNNQFPTITTPSSLIPGSSTSSLYRNQQHPPQIAEQDSDIEIDDVSTL